MHQLVAVNCVRIEKPQPLGEMAMDSFGAIAWDLPKLLFNRSTRVQMTRASSKAKFDFSRRGSGVLMHITSLPGPHGSGDLGPEAHRFIEFLAEARQTWWQMLPIGPTGRAPGYSPYDSPSTFAGNPHLVSLEALAERGLLKPSELKPAAGLSARRVNFAATQRFRETRLRCAFDRFVRLERRHQREFNKFCHRNADWLDDAALFESLRRHFQNRPWPEWETSVRRREPAALRDARQRLAEEMDFYRFVQFEFDRQWRTLRDHAQRRGVGLIGDLPMFVAHDSADVWSNPKLFQLDKHGRPRRVSGYPPDRFNPDGQRWGHPQYEWKNHLASGFEWWVRRLGRIFELFDALRIDHFLGLTRTWSIPGDAPTAAEGRWVSSPGSKLLRAAARKLGHRPMIAEDLGHVTRADVRLRNGFGLAPMRIFQFGFGNEADSADHLPHQYSRLCAGYTGSHDTDTIVGWLSHLPPSQQRRALKYIGSSDSSTHLAAIRAVMASKARLVIVPMQDVLGLDHRARMNIPGTAQGNWRWRLPLIDLDIAAKELRRLTEAGKRTS